jgi:hypothetical protein
MCISKNLALYNRGNISTEKKGREEKMIKRNEKEV